MASFAPVDDVEGVIESLTGADDVDAAVSLAVRCCFSGDVAGLEELIKRVPGVVSAHDPTFNDSTALHIAVGEDEDALALVLLEAGAPPNAVDVEGRAPLHHISAGASQRLIDALLAAGAEINKPDWRGRTPLMYAAAAMSVSAVDAMLKAGADAGAVAADGSTSLGIARKGEDEEDEEDEEEDEDEEAAPKLSRRNHLVCQLLEARGAQEETPQLSWESPDLDAHEFMVMPAAGTEPATWTAGARVQIVITACFDPEDEDYDGGDDEDEPDEDVEENDIVEATVEVELLEQDSLSGGWRCWLTETPMSVHNKVPQIMLVAGRELVVPTRICATVDENESPEP